MSKHPVSWILLAAVVMAMAGCGAPGQGTGEDLLQNDVSQLRAPWLLLNLADGSLQGRVDIADIGTNNAYRDEVMVFHRIEGGTAQVGAVAGGFGAEVDPAAVTVSLTPYYIGAFEVTQGQWQRLAGTTPWTGVVTVPAGAVGPLTTDNALPAYGLSVLAVTTALDVFNARAPHALSIPSDAQWECACRGATTSAYWWGDDPALQSLATDYAVLLDTRGSALGPHQVAQRQPNPFGIYDMLGNVAEITRTGAVNSLRGGSWDASIAQARCAMKIAVEHDTAHALAGVRLVLVP